MDHHNDHREIQKRGCLESSLRCLCIPCAVTGRVTQAVCCPSPPPPEEWNLGFRALMALMKAVTINVIRSVRCVRCCTDCAVPPWLPSLPNGLTIMSQRANDDHPCSGEWIVPSTMKDDPREKCPRRVILYFHGGAFALCKPSTHRGITMRIVGEMKTDAPDVGLFTIKYSRPPEHPYPEPVKDLVDAYKWLLQHMGGGEGAASRIVFGGDSAGGALQVYTFAELRRQGIPLPAGGIMISPWVDLVDISSGSWSENEKYDYLSADLAQMFAKGFAGSKTLEEVSATNQDLTSFPPLYIVCGEKEVLRDQVIAFSEKAKDAGVDVELTVEPGMVHAFVAFSDVVDPDIVGKWYGNIVNFIYKVLDDYTHDHDILVEEASRSRATGFVSGIYERVSSYSLVDDSSKNS